MRIRYFLLAVLLSGGLQARAQVALTKLGTVAVPSAGVTLAVNATHAYVLTAYAGTQQLAVYDVSNAAAPQLLKTLNLPTGLPPRHAVLSGTTLYVSTFPSFSQLPHPVDLLAIDVSNPAAPTVRTTLTVQSSYFNSDELLLAASGSTLYATFDFPSYVTVYDSNLTYLKRVNLPYSISSILGFTLSGSTAYVQYATPSYSTLNLATPTTPVSSGGTTAGTVSAASGTLAFGLQLPAYQTAPLSNNLLVYDVSNPLAPTLARTLPGSFGTSIAAGGQSVFTVGATSPFLPAGPSSVAPLRGYYFPAGAASAVEAVDASSRGANGLAVVGNKAYLLTDTNLAIYSFPATVTATRAATALTSLPLYPNPARSQVSLPQLAAGTPVAVYDATGRCCLQAMLPASGRLELATLSPGLYQVRAGTTVSKLVVE